MLGLKENERKALSSILESFGTPTELMPTFITNETGQGKDRAGKYEILYFVILFLALSNAYGISNFYWNEQ